MSSCAKTDYTNKKRLEHLKMTSNYSHQVQTHSTKGCWAKFSPVGRTALLILMIGVPYMILMIFAVTHNSMSPSPFLHVEERHPAHKSKGRLSFGYEPAFYANNKFKQKKTSIKVTTLGDDPGDELEYGDDETELYEEEPMLEAENPEEQSRRRRRTQMVTDGHKVINCPPCLTQCSLEASKNPSIVAINEITYVDDPDDGDYRYRCVGVIKDNVILTSAECFDETNRTLNMYQIKAGTNQWTSLTASTHQISQKSPWKNRSIVTLDLAEPLPESDAIKSVIISDSAMKPGDYYMWMWTASHDKKLKHRFKSASVENVSVRLEDKCTSCSAGMCVHEEMIGDVCSDYYYTSGNPIFDGQGLVGMQVEAHCVDSGKILERCFVSTSETRRRRKK